MLVFCFGSDSHFIEFPFYREGTVYRYEYATKKGEYDVLPKLQAEKHSGDSSIVFFLEF